jgi:hypothetical protein
MAKFRIYTCCENLGDGSYAVRKFGTQEQLDAYVEAYNEDSSEYIIQDDDCGWEDLEFDDNGVLTNPDVYEPY